jgi:hypothetical protein
MEKTVHRVTPARMGKKAHRVLLVSLVKNDLQAHRDSPAKMAHRALRAEMEKMGKMDHRATQVGMDVLGKTDLRDLRGLRDLRDHLAKIANMFWKCFIHLASRSNGISQRAWNRTRGMFMTKSMIMRTMTKRDMNQMKMSLIDKSIFASK